MRILIGSFRGWARVLPALLGRRKHAPLHVWGCSICGRLSADIREDPNAWNGWEFDEKDHYCPECIKDGMISVDCAIDLEELRARYLRKIDEIKNKCGGNHET